MVRQCQVCKKLDYLSLMYVFTIYLGGPPVTMLGATHKLFFDVSNRAAIEMDADTMMDNEFFRKIAEAKKNQIKKKTIAQMRDTLLDDEPYPIQDDQWIYWRGPPVSRLWAKHNLVVDSSNRAVVEYDYDYDNEFMRDHNSTTDVPSSVTDPKKEGDDKTKLRQFRVPERPNIVLEFQKPDMYNLQDMEEPEPFFFY